MRIVEQTDIVEAEGLMDFKQGETRYVYERPTLY